MPKLNGLLCLVRRQVLGQAHVASVGRPLPLCLQSGVRMMSSEPPEHHPDSREPWIPEYIEKFHEPLEVKRSRLMYQSRKRGMLENGLLLGILELFNLLLSIHIKFYYPVRKFCQEIPVRNGRREACSVRQIDQPPF